MVTRRKAGEAKLVEGIHEDLGKKVFFPHADQTAVPSLSDPAHQITEDFIKELRKRTSDLLVEVLVKRFNEVRMPPHEPRKGQGIDR